MQLEFITEQERTIQLGYTQQANDAVTMKGLAGFLFLCSFNDEEFISGIVSGFRVWQVTPKLDEYINYYMKCVLPFQAKNVKPMNAKKAK